MAEKSGRSGERRSVAAWEPRGGIESFLRGPLFRDLGERGGMMRWMDELFGERGASRRELAPALDVHESDDAYEVSIELPGVKKDDVSVELAEGVVTVHGEKRCERSEEKERGRWRERVYGSFQRSFSLPDNASPDRIEASFRDGVLTLRIAKREPSKPKTIAVQ